ncbi:MAG TPA: hypothetical protein VI423_10845 [Paenisporosarcina sp.]|nr:hypothetical protein [Paenisporosarcina sp.]
MPKLKHMVNLVIGDWSADGHAQAETLTIRSNIDKKAIKKAYKVGSKKLKIDLVKNVAHNYGDNWIGKANWEKFATAGLTIQKLKTFKHDRNQAKAYLAKGEGFILSADSFAKLYLFIVKQGNQQFEYEKINNSNINIGGYGLFDLE